MSVRDMAAEFVEENTEFPMINYVKEHVFGKADGLPLVPRNHHVLAVCYQHTSTLLSSLKFKFVDEFRVPPNPHLEPWVM